MGFFKDLWKGLEKLSERHTLMCQWEQLKEMRGTGGINGPDYDVEYFEKYGETPAQKRLREFEEEHGLREKS